MDIYDFERTINETANKLLRRKMLVFTIVSIATAGAVVATTAVIAKKMLNKISVHEDWSDVDWGIEEDEYELI